MTTLPAVDIVTASFNSARHISGMIGSVLQQDYPRLSLFVQDGGSSDGTLEILKQAGCRFATAPDTGISQALNRAIAATSGDIVGFTSTDDLLQPGAVAAAVQVFTECPHVVMVYGDCYRIDQTGRIIKLWRSQPFDLDWLCWNDYIPYQTVYIRREVLADVGGFDESLRLVQDLDLWLRIGGRYPAESLAYLPRVQGSFRLDSASAGLNDPAEALRCHRQVSTRFLNNADHVQRLRGGRDRASVGNDLMSIGYLVLSGQRWRAVETYVRAVCQCPRFLLTLRGATLLPRILAGPVLQQLVHWVQRMIWGFRKR
jgi:glycosyltransferase involved in cell wall biosynthesis